MGKIIERVRQRQRHAANRPGAFIIVGDPLHPLRARRALEQNIEALTKCEWFPNVLADRPKPRPWWAFWRR